MIFLRLGVSILLSVSNAKQTDKQTYCQPIGPSMTKPPADESPLSPHRAFVVQLRDHADVERGHWVGRVEHVTSGQATRFQSLEELLTFVARVLAARPKQDPDE